MMTQFVRNEHERLLNKKVIGIGYDCTQNENDGSQNAYVLLIIVKGKEFYFYSESPIELEIRDVQ